MWNERYSSDEYAYGIEPNTFLKDNADQLYGNILSLCEGEGRNGVFLAQQGMQVLGVDSSDVGLAKAQKLANEKGVQIDTLLADLVDYNPEPNSFDGVVSIFAHLPRELRKNLYPKVIDSLKKGGILLLEAYSEDQINKNTGGPKSLDMLMSIQKIQREFPNFEILHLEELEREVNEGIFHQGVASVVQFIGRKK